jgi:hypothetical protein
VIVRKFAGQDLQRDIPTELAVPCAIDLTHAPAAEGAQDFIRTESGTGHQKHEI